MVPPSLGFHGSWFPSTLMGGGAQAYVRAMIRKGEVELVDLELWRLHAGPKRPSQWKDHRSAKECARAWLGCEEGRLPPEVEIALLTHADFEDIETWVGEPEARVPFDFVGGEPANIDVMVRGSDSDGQCVIAVEAKADESFGATVEDTIASAKRRLRRNPRSGGITRIEGLAHLLFGLSGDEIGSLAPLRYQLLTASAAALAEAERVGARRAVVLVHEFVTPATQDNLHESNALDLNRFLQRLSGNLEDSVEPGRLRGPLRVPGCLEEPMIGLYLGKAVRNTRAFSAPCNA